MKRTTTKRPRNVSAWQVQAVRYEQGAGGYDVEVTVRAQMPQKRAREVYGALVEQMKASGSVNIRIDRQTFRFMDGIRLGGDVTYTATRPSDGGQR